MSAVRSGVSGPPAAEMPESAARAASEIWTESLRAGRAEPCDTGAGAPPRFSDWSCTFAAGFCTAGRIVLSVFSLIFMACLLVVYYRPDPANLYRTTAAPRSPVLLPRPRLGGHD